jgi:phage terminase large subunit-like protein
MIARDLKHKYGMRMVTYHESMNKHVKIATYLKAIWQYVIFVEGTDDEYINQILDYNEDAEHDDCADSAASLARKLYKKANIHINIGLNDEIKEEEE